MIANYCFPLSWPSSTQRTELRKTPSVHFSFSIHPRIVNSSSSSNLQQYLTDLEYLIKSSRTVAVGECGLDNTAKSLQLDKQIKKKQRNYQGQLMETRTTSTSHESVHMEMRVCNRDGSRMLNSQWSKWQSSGRFVHFKTS
jgi:Tat protein secretion system quality control protein TatD with DNase activity